MNPKLILAVVAVFLLAARPSAQCPNPAVPPGGFAVTRVLNQLVTYGDTAQTLMDVRYPSATPPSCGWPVVILVHGAGASRAAPETAYDAELYATQGYVTVAYDVRGQGAALSLNPASLWGELVGRSERLDLAEIVAIVKQRFGNGIADVSRLGITGYSQGAAHSWAAAAWSGRTLPANNRGLTTFPVFKAARPDILAPTTPDLVVVGKHAFSFAVRNVLSTVGLRPAFQQPLVAAIAAGDTAAVTAIIGNDPWRQDLAYLKSSTVPVMATAQWNDVFGPVDLTVQALDAMPTTTPTRAFLSAVVAHGEPMNVRQWAQNRSFSLRWFDRFLKGMKNDVDTEPRFVTGVVPESTVLYNNQNTLLWHRYRSTWPPAGTTRSRFHLRQGQSLSRQAPTSAESPEMIQHRVQSGWTMNRYVTQNGANPALLPQIFALSSTAYDTPALAAPVEIIGSPSLELEVSPQPSSTDYQLHCALYQVPSNGPERYLQTGVAVVKGNASAQRLTIDFGDIDVYVPAGDKLRLRIENLTRRRPPGNYYTIPFFVNATVAVEHTVLRPSWLELPFADSIQPALTSATLDFDSRTPADVVFDLDATPLRAGASYFLAFGTSGITPGTTLPGSTLPGSRAMLNADALTVGLLPLLNTTFLPNGLGTLDPNGKAPFQPRIALGSYPPLGAFVGLRLNAIALVSSGNGWLPSNPLDVFFR